MSGRTIIVSGSTIGNWVREYKNKIVLGTTIILSGSSIIVSGSTIILSVSTIVVSGSTIIIQVVD